jgi:hypothetical protein
MVARPVTVNDLIDGDLGRRGARRFPNGYDAKMNAKFKDRERLHRRSWDDLQTKLRDVNAICRPARVDAVGQGEVTVVGLEVECLNHVVPIFDATLLGSCDDRRDRAAH